MHIIYPPIPVPPRSHDTFAMSSAQILKRTFYASIACLSTTALYHHHQVAAPPTTTANAKRTMLPSYEATFSVPLSCDSCVEDISSALSTLPGIHSTSFSLPSQLVRTTGTAAPSSIISTIQSTGRPAILRGSGAPNSAAVCILELPPTSISPSPTPSPVRGLIRLIQLSPRLALLDLTVTSLPAGRYRATLRQSGDISRGAASMGGELHVSTLGGGDQTETETETETGGEWGSLVVDAGGRGAVVGEVGAAVGDMVGRGVVVERVMEGEGEGEREVQVVGVVARSAGVWENEKVVCACSGKTVWQEREEMRAKGVV